MELFQNLALGFGIALTLTTLSLAIIGCILGTIIGALPGLGPSNGVAILIPLAFTLELDATQALVLMTSVYYGAMYGGRISSILLNIPGDEPAMMTTLDGQFTPNSYTPLRFTFVIYVMVIVGGSGNNLGAILGGFLIWFFWVESEPIGIWIIDNTTKIFGEESAIRLHLLESIAHMRYMTMGLILLLVLRFAPKGLIPEEKL